MTGLKIETVRVGPIRTNCYILSLDSRSDCLVIDPGAQSAKIREHTDGKKIAAILFTHGHFDHIGGGKGLLEEGTRVYIHPLDEPMLHDTALNSGRTLLGQEITGPDATDRLSDGEEIEAAGIPLTVIHTPGHTQGSVCFYVKDDLLFSGDTVMNMGIGRTDLAGGSMEDMRRSLQKLHPYLASCRLFGGHG